MVGNLMNAMNATSQGLKSVKNVEIKHLKITHTVEIVTKIILPLLTQEIVNHVKQKTVNLQPSLHTVENVLFQIEILITIIWCQLVKGVI